MLLFKFFKNSLLLTIIVLLGCGSKEIPKLRSERYLITSDDDISERWAEYAYRQLLNRSSDKTIFRLNESRLVGEKEIHIEVNSQLKNDYCISHKQDLLIIKIRNEEIALWMVYQLIQEISNEDYRINSQDLNPATVNFQNECVAFDFDYREPYYSTNLKEDYAAITGNANIETKWGIWGHNLNKVIKEVDVENMYALIDGKRDEKQWCFSSKELLGEVIAYIDDNFGDSSIVSNNFMIMPQDNDLVCQCNKCLNAGNTANSASPAVANFVNKLAKRYKKYHFFTSAYRTTKEIPIEKMALNTGVVLSTIDLPKGIHLHSKQSATKKFIEDFHQWKSKTNNIYIWDYNANFDDYLTPIPTLYSLQTQLKFYKKIGVKGIFINAGGYDYMPFDDMKTYVAGELMKQIDLSVDTLICQYFKKFYPTSHELLTSYYLNLEKHFIEKSKRYELYGGFRDIYESYFDSKEFVDFYEELGKVISMTEDKEKKKLTQLHIALTFTRLQLAYNLGGEQGGYAISKPYSLEVKPIVIEWVNELEQSKKYNIFNYREVNGSIDNYLSFWKDTYTKKEYENLLKGITIDILSKKDEGYEDTTLLNDCKAGYEQDYHIGWYLSSIEDLHLRIPTKTFQDEYILVIRFLDLAKHNFYLPDSIEFWEAGKKITQITNEDLTRENNSGFCRVLLDLREIEQLEIKIIKQRKEHRNILACDEVQLIKL